MRNVFRLFSVLLPALFLCLTPLASTLQSEGERLFGGAGGREVSGLARAASPTDRARELNVRSAIIIDMKTGRVLYEQDADRRIPPASLTKIISMLVAMDKIRTSKISLRDNVKVSGNAARQAGSKMHIRQGEVLSLDRLLMGMAVSSGNDASVAVAEHVAGSSARFVRLMNAKARQLGMKNSSFKNPNGLPAKGQVTTARDMSLLARHYLRTYPEALRYHKMRTLTHRGRTTTNKNPLLGTCPGADGLKTGWITASGYNIVSTVARGNTRMLAVLLGAPSSAIRSEEIRRLIEAGFEANRRGVSVATLLRGDTGKGETVASAAPSGERKAKIGKPSSKSKKMTAAKKTKPSRQKARVSSAGKKKALGSAAARSNVKKAGARQRSTATVSRNSAAASGKTGKSGMVSAKKTGNAKPLANSVKARRARNKTESPAEGRDGRSGDAYAGKARADASRSVNL